MNTQFPRDTTLSWGSTNTALWLPAIRARANPALRLIAFPYAGGGIPIFRGWPDLLPEQIELRAVQLPGRGPRLREARFHEVREAINALEPHLIPLLDRPFAFFGHSMGAVLAFEMARRLQFRGFTPLHLFVSGRIAPQRPSPFTPIHGCPDREFLQHVIRLNGMSSAVLNSPELLEIVLPSIRSDFTLLETCQFEEGPDVLSCPITAFGGAEDSQTTSDALADWKCQSHGSFDLQILPGDHFFLDSARADLVRMILERLKKSSGPTCPELIR